MIELGSATAVEVAVRTPKTLPPSATVAQARAELTDDHVHLLLVVRAGRLLGTVTREDIDGVADDGPALDHARLCGRTISPGVPAEVALDLMRTSGARRLAVVDAAGTLLGLLCLKRHRRGFCRDLDVWSRRVERAAVMDSRTCLGHTPVRS